MPQVVEVDTSEPYRGHDVLPLHNLGEVRPAQRIPPAWLFQPISSQLIGQNRVRGRVWVRLPGRGKHRSQGIDPRRPGNPARRIAEQKPQIPSAVIVGLMT
ncbi:hypothetical protein [Nocardia sp. NPDC004415]